MADKQEVLAAVNEVLGTQYIDLDTVTEAELQRVWTELKIATLLNEHPDIKIFMCRPNEGIDNDASRRETT